MFGEARVAASKTDVFPSPSAGWVRSGNIVTASPNQAEILDNFVVTAQGARLRDGCVLLDELGAEAKSLFVYEGGTTSRMFGATALAIFDATNVSGGALRVTTSGDWSTTQISTAGGDFLGGVNGADNAFTYDGSSFSDMSLTGVAGSNLSQMWLFKERWFFVEKDTLSAWYLPVKSIGGTVAEINLGAVFRRGGNLLFGATWSLDSGSGLDDVCIFVSTEGEVAVYEGTDPTSASTWSLVGVYDIGRPLNKHASFKAGGDLAILTRDGVISVAEALRKDRASLQASAITYPIEDVWQSLVANASNSNLITATLWQSRTLLLIGTVEKDAGNPVSLVANARNGGWSRVTGWDVRCSVVFQDRLYFATLEGDILEADKGGTDNGVEFSGVYVPKFTNSANYRSANAAGITYRAGRDVEFDLSAHSEYSIDEPSLRTTTNTFSDATSTWGTGVWGSFVWGGDQTRITKTEWQTVYANGYALAPGLIISSNQPSSMNFEILMTRLRYERGYAL